MREPAGWSKTRYSESFICYIFRWRNISAKISESTPSFCSMYAISYGKLSSLRPSDTETMQALETIVVYQVSPLMIYQTTVEERLESGLYSRSYLENQIIVALGGRVAEELIFGEDNVTTGASKDFMQVSRVARQMIERFGFCKKIGQSCNWWTWWNPFMGQQVQHGHRTCDAE